MHKINTNIYCGTIYKVRTLNNKVISLLIKLLSYMTQNAIHIHFENGNVLMFYNLRQNYHIQNQNQLFLFLYETYFNNGEIK